MTEAEAIIQAINTPEFRDKLASVFSQAVAENIDEIKDLILKP